MISRTRYSAFGLIIESEIPCPDFAASEGKPDVTVCRGTVPATLGREAEKGARYEVSEDAFLLTVDGIGRYLVDGSEKIVVEASVGVSDSDLFAFLTGSPLAALLIRKGMLVLHAAVIERDGRAIALAGPSGSGKSHLAATLIRQGFRLLSDELCALQVAPGGAAMAAPGFPALHVWRSTLAELGVEGLSLRKVRAGMEFFSLPAESRFAEKNTPLAAVLLLRSPWYPLPAGVVGSPARKLEALLQVTYRLSFLGSSARRREHLQACASVARVCEFENISDDPSAGAVVRAWERRTEWP